MGNVGSRDLAYEVSEKGKDSVGNQARDHPCYTLIKNLGGLLFSKGR